MRHLDYIEHLFETLREAELSPPSQLVQRVIERWEEHRLAAAAPAPRHLHGVPEIPNTSDPTEPESA